MRFMVFFSTKSILDKKSQEVTEWFKTIYSDYDINTITIYSKAIEKKNVQKLINMKNEPNKIDLIFSINMLNEGYHIEDITGCILLRPTRSQTVYKQQVGRSMQVGMEYRPIIIDLVENLDTKALFGVDVAPSKQSTVNSEISKQLNDLNYINSKNIHIVDKVADIRELIEKLNNETCNSVEEEVKDPWGNEFKSKKEMCEHYGVSTNTYKKGIRKGKDAKDILLHKKSIYKSTPIRATDDLGNVFNSIRSI